PGTQCPWVRRRPRSKQRVHNALRVDGRLQCRSRPGLLAPGEPHLQDREYVDYGGSKEERCQNVLALVAEIVCNGTCEGGRRILPELVAWLFFARALEKQRHAPRERKHC